MRTEFNSVRLQHLVHRREYMNIYRGVILTFGYFSSLIVLQWRNKEGMCLEDETPPSTCQNFDEFFF